MGSVGSVTVVSEVKRPQVFNFLYSAKFIDVRSERESGRVSPRFHVADQYRQGDDKEAWLMPPPQWMVKKQFLPPVIAGWRSLQHLLKA